MRAASTLDGLLVSQTWIYMSIGEVGYFKMVISEINGVFDWVPEGSVARFVLVFVLVHKESLRADDAVISANIIQPPVLTCERSLGTLVLSDIELMRWESTFHRLSVIPLPILHEGVKCSRVLKHSWLLIVVVTIYWDCQVFVDNLSIFEFNHIPEFVGHWGIHLFLSESNLG